MSSNDTDARFEAMEDSRVSKFGLANFLVAHLIVLAAFGFWYVYRDSLVVAGLPTAVWVILLAIPVLWIQFWYFIRNSELRLERPEGSQ